jgi:glucokinase
MEAEARRRYAAGEPTKLVDLAGDQKMKSATFLKALDAGDRMAIELIDEAVEALGVAISTATLLIDLDHVVLGGGLAEKLGEKFVGRVEEAVRSHKWGSLLVNVIAATLGDDSGVVGAALLFE